MPVITECVPSLAHIATILVFIAPLLARPAEIFRVATYNIQNYLETASGTRPAKSEAAKAKVRESIRATRADVIALQEVGSTNALLELRDSLMRDGMEFPFWEHVAAWDTNIHVAVLSRFPIVARRSHTNDSFLVFNKRHYVKRGFAEIDLRVNSRYTFTLFTAHLKSKLTVFEADEQELRDEEAAILRQKVDSILSVRPNANLVVAGDLNDVRDSKPVRTVIGRKNALHDVQAGGTKRGRPAE